MQRRIFTDQMRDEYTRIIIRRILVAVDGGSLVFQVSSGERPFSVCRTFFANCRRPVPNIGSSSENQTTELGSLVFLMMELFIPIIFF